MENQPKLYVIKTVDDKDIRQAFEEIFSCFGNNVIEQIELLGNHKIVHISKAIYEASIVSEDDIYEEFEYTGRLTFGVYNGTNGKKWCYGSPADFRGPNFNVRMTL
jgi:hypothetical protein